MRIMGLINVNRGHNNERTFVGTAKVAAAAK